MWTDVIDHNKSVAKQRGDSGRPDGVLFVVGSRGCGKTTLVNRLLYPDKTEVPKPTEGMEYNYARRAQSGAGGGGGVDRKDVAHVWEIAGSRHFADEVTEQDNVFLGPRHVTTAVVAICVDLAKPHEAMRTAEYWLGRVHARCAKTFEKLAARGSRLPEQLVRRSERVFAGGRRRRRRGRRRARGRALAARASLRRDGAHRGDEARRVAANGPGAHEGVGRALRFLPRKRRRPVLPGRFRRGGR